MGGGTTDPTLVTLPSRVLLRGKTATVTIDLDKSYIFVGTYRFNDGTYRSEVQTIIKGVVTSLTNNYGATYITLCTISGTTLTYGSTDLSSQYYIDYELVQLD